MRNKKKSWSESTWSTIIVLTMFVAIGGFVFMVNYGFTDAGRAKVRALGDPARVTCYSAGKTIFDSCSTGKVHNESNSDGYFFKETSTGLPVEVSGDCVITYNAKCPTPVGVATTP